VPLKSGDNHQLVKNTLHQHHLNEQIYMKMYVGHVITVSQLQRSLQWCTQLNSYFTKYGPVCVAAAG